jgi:hypothetical protein
MTAADSNQPDLNQRAFLARLQTADTALRAGLGQDCIERLARAHIERALAHIREAETALHNLAHARTVTDLADQLARIDEMRAELREQEAGITPAPASIRI